MSGKYLLLPLITVLAFVPSTEARSRAVKHPCKAATVTITSSSSAVCANESVRLSWSASDPSALVTVDGVGTNLPATGSALVSVPKATTFNATAKSACGGVAQGSSVSVAMRPDASATLSSPTSTTQGTSVSIFISTVNASSWTLSSSLGNGLDPATGSGNGDFTSSYHASVSGTDTLQLRVSGLCGSSSPLQSYYRTIAVNSNTPVPTPQPTGYLRCCDGTLSPTCTSCANKQGCCSHHGGVCGC